MIIRCWGSRGSIAVSGRQYLKYGGDTTCIEVESDSGEVIVIDAGTGIRALGKKLINSRSLNISLLLTHAHWDHLSGFPFFDPIYRKDSTIRVYGPQTTQNSLKRILSKTMTSPYFPVELDDISANISFLGMGNSSYSIGGVHISTIPISHPNTGVGYRFAEDGKTFVFLTDNELTYTHPGGLPCREYERFARGADLLYHDAEYRKDEYRKKKGWGHSVYLDTLKLAMDGGVKRLGLFHHNQERTDREIDDMVKDCRAKASARGSKLKCFAVGTGAEVRL